jgi:hypothetical protein
LLAAPPALARPTYFETFKSTYGIPDGANLDACGVCHFLWTGSGGRNPYGTAVEQQLYLGKSITQSILDVEPDDSDADGFTNIDEIMNFMTLPGYSCDNFHQAVGAPQGYDTYITPLVASCLEPLDIRLSPSGQIGFVAKPGEVKTADLTIFNNGSTDVLTISSWGLLAGADPEFTVTGPPAPFDIAVGANVVLEVEFAPVVDVVGAEAFLRIESNDPDPEEAVIDVELAGTAIAPILAPADKRAACLQSVDKGMRKYSKKHLREWGACYLDEVIGLACDTGTLDVKVQAAEDKLRARVGGAKDRRCAGESLTPSLLGLPQTCGGTCSSITVNSMVAYADCLVCRQDEAMRAWLSAALGTAPPDLPPNEIAVADAQSCQARLLKASSKAVDKVTKELARCELGNVTAASIVDCTDATSEKVAKIRSKVDATPARCKDTQDLLGCLFEGGGASCLGEAAETIGTDLADTVYGSGE